jgi:hypothetical protein
MPALAIADRETHAGHGKVGVVIALAALCWFAIQQGYSVHLNVGGAALDLDLRPPQSPQGQAKSEQPRSAAPRRRVSIPSQLPRPRGCTGDEADGEQVAGAKR